MEDFSLLLPFIPDLFHSHLLRKFADFKSKVEAGIGKQWMTEHRVGDMAKAAQQKVLFFFSFSEQFCIVQMWKKKKKKETTHSNMG